MQKSEKDVSFRGYIADREACQAQEIWGSVVHDEYKNGLDALLQGYI